MRNTFFHVHGRSMPESRTFPGISLIEWDERIMAFLVRRQGTLVFILCLLGAARVFVYSAAFPFFGNVDEFQHFDMVAHYSEEGTLHEVAPPYNRHALHIKALVATREYEGMDLNGENGIHMRKRGNNLEVLCLQQEKLWQGHINYEGQQPPIYYMLSGWLYGQGSSLGLEHEEAVYLIRHTNMLWFCGLPLMTWLMVRRFFGNETILCLGAVLVVALMPQDSFYTISNDVLHPILFALALYKIMGLAKGPTTIGDWFLTGVLIAAAFLTKFSTVVLFVVLAPALIMVMVRSPEIRPIAVKAGLLCLAAGIPITLWMLRNHLQTGAVTGNAEHITRLKSLTEVSAHPFFTREGATLFFRRTITHFWRGELIWHGHWLQKNLPDAFYIGSSSIVLASVFQLRKCGMIFLCFTAVGGSVLFLLGLSLAFDYSGLFNPPYIVAGRMIYGAVVPFAVLYVRGLQTISGPLPLKTLPLWLLIIAMTWITWGEWQMTKPVFSSGFNWYHSAGR